MTSDQDNKYKDNHKDIFLSLLDLGTQWCNIHDICKKLHFYEIL